MLARQTDSIYGDLFTSVLTYDFIKDKHIHCFQMGFAL